MVSPLHWGDMNFMKNTLVLLTFTAGVCSLTKKLEKESLSCSGPVGQDLPRQRTERLFEVVALHSSR